jgi:hypothetical protein
VQQVGPIRRGPVRARDGQERGSLRVVVSGADGNSPTGRVVPGEEAPDHVSGARATNETQVSQWELWSAATASRARALGSSQVPEPATEAQLGLPTWRVVSSPSTMSPRSNTFRPSVSQPVLVVKTFGRPFLTGCEHIAPRIPDNKLLLVDVARHDPVLAHSTNVRVVRTCMDDFA